MALEDLAEPFPADKVHRKPQAVSADKTKCLVSHYVTARDVMDRLDEAVGPGGWRDEYGVLPSGSVRCRLSVKCGQEWVTKEDVGSPSEQPDEGDRTKAAYSDALKRAAIKWGVGRYLYSLPPVWAAYDAQKKKILDPMVLPEWALPKAKPKKAEMPTDGPSLRSWIIELDMELTSSNRIRKRQLYDHVKAKLMPEGYPASYEQYADGQAVARAVAEAYLFLANLGGKAA
jgi:hypothetical protein